MQLIISLENSNTCRRNFIKFYLALELLLINNILLMLRVIVHLEEKSIH